MSASVSPKTRISCVAAALALIAATLGACGDEEETETGTEVATPEQTAAATGAEGGTAEAQAVLEGVIDRDINDPGYHGGGFRSDPALSAGLLEQIAEIEATNEAEGFPGLDFDPFLCAQNIPIDVRFKLAGTSGSTATFVGQLAFGDAKSKGPYSDSYSTIEKVTYVMFLDDNEWKLDSTECVDAAQPKGE